MRRLVALAPFLILAGVACSDTTDEETTPRSDGSAPAATTAVSADTTAAAPSTTRPKPTTTPDEPTTAAAEGADGIGDSLFPTYGNGGYDVQAYDIALSWDPESGEIDAVATIAAKATQALSSFNLDFDGPPIESVTVNDETADSDRNESELTISPVDVIEEGDSFSVAVSYAGKPGAADFGGWLEDGNGGIIAFGEPEVSSYWYPVNDHPLDKAAYTLRVTAPRALTVASNGTLADKKQAGDATEWTYTQPFPQAPYLTTLAIGDYEIVDGGRSASGVPVRNVFPRDQVEELTEQFAQQPKMIDVFEEAFGPYPFDTYGALVINGDVVSGVALENQTMSVFGAGALDEAVQAHELAHQWFGDSVSLADWSDLWLNEGFATYGEYVWQESVEPGFDTTDTLEVFFDDSGFLDQAPTDLAPGFAELFTASVYLRGGMTLHALRLEVGDDAFFETLQQYAADYRHANATTDDFIAVAEEVSAKQLDDLFDEWLNAPKLPEGFG
jgi:aminopeptidase N